MAQFVINLLYMVAATVLMVILAAAVFIFVALIVGIFRGFNKDKDEE